MATDFIWQTKLICCNLTAIPHPAKRAGFGMTIQSNPPRMTDSFVILSAAKNPFFVGWICPIDFITRHNLF